jgi:hypothetical protein
MQIETIIYYRWDCPKLETGAAQAWDWHLKQHSYWDIVQILK